MNSLAAKLVDRQYDRRFPPPGRRRPGPRGEIISVHDYHAVDGALLYRAVYFRAWSRRTYQHPDGAGGWTWGLKGIPRVLYRLPQLAAADPAAWVFIVPRERDADALAVLGLVATCCPSGAGKWGRLSDWTALAGRKVCIVLANNEEGLPWINADDLAPRLASRVAEVKILALPGDYKTVTAWLQAETAAETKTKGRRTHV